MSIEYRIDDTSRGHMGLAARLSHWRPGRYIRSSSILLAWLLIRAAAQAVLFFRFGSLSGGRGLRLVHCFVGCRELFLTAGHLRHPVDSGEKCRTEAWGCNSQLRACLAFYLGTMIPLILAASAAALLLLPSPPPFPAIAVLALSEIGASSLVELLARSEQSQHHIGKFGGGRRPRLDAVAVFLGLHFIR